MDYQPDYAEGEIVVRFNLEVSTDFARTFGRLLSYDLKDKSRFSDNCFIYQTETGREREAVEKFSIHSGIVDWASLRDIRLESTWNNLEQIVNSIRELQDNLKISDEEYVKRITQICVSLKKCD